MSSRIYNFGAGPAMLPEPILQEAQREFLDWQGTGMSILEIGHRSEEFTALLNHADQSLRALLKIPPEYQVLFLGGAARTQFAMIPLNFLNNKQEAGYLISGLWSALAFEEAKHLKKAYSLTLETSKKTSGFLPQNLNIKDNTAYLYCTPNETVDGIRLPFVPSLPSHIPLFADMTSCLLSEPIDVSNYGLIFAGAQKNIANAGLTIVIIKNDLLEKSLEHQVPTMLQYKKHAQHHSLYATPPAFNCYLAAKMFDWIKAQGGVQALYDQNLLKAATLYQYLDSSDFYITSVDPAVRSIMNICFSLKNRELEPLFITQAALRGLYALKGHRSAGGIRASLYNAMPQAGVEALIDFMDEFAQGYGS